LEKLQLRVLYLEEKYPLWNGDIAGSGSEDVVKGSRTIEVAVQLFDPELFFEILRTLGGQEWCHEIMAAIDTKISPKLGHEVLIRTFAPTLARFYFVQRAY